MIYPGIVAQRRHGGGGDILWTPLNMSIVPPIYLDTASSALTQSGGACSEISNLGSFLANGNFAQADPSRMPSVVNAELNGLPVLRFDGTSDFMYSNSGDMKTILSSKTSAWSFFIYKKRGADATPTDRALVTFLGDGPARFAHFCGSSTAGRANTPYSLYNLGESSVGFLYGASATYGSYSMSCADLNLQSGSFSLYRNAQVNASASVASAAFPATPSSPSFNAASIGARGDAVWMPDIDLAVMIVGNQALSTTDRQKIEGWAAHKFALTSLLPAAHPYKALPPYI